MTGAPMTDHQRPSQTTYSNMLLGLCWFGLSCLYDVVLAPPTSCALAYWSLLEPDSVTSWLHSSIHIINLLVSLYSVYLKSVIWKSTQVDYCFSCSFWWWSHPLFLGFSEREAMCLHRKFDGQILHTQNYITPLTSWRGATGCLRKCLTWRELKVMKIMIWNEL